MLTWWWCETISRCLIFSGSSTTTNKPHGTYTPCVSLAWMQKSSGQTGTSFSKCYVRLCRIVLCYLNLSEALNQIEYLMFQKLLSKVFVTFRERFHLRMGGLACFHAGPLKEESQAWPKGWPDEDSGVGISKVVLHPTEHRNWMKIPQKIAINW